MDKNDLLYQKIANGLEKQILKDGFKVGDKLPSLRTICQEMGVSLTTASQAYLELESRGLIESRPRYGYFVSPAIKNYKKNKENFTPNLLSQKYSTEDIFDILCGNFGKAELFLSSGLISLELLPVEKLNKAIVNATRVLPDSGINYDRYGNQKLKKQVAIRSFLWGGELDESEIITTSGCMDAITFCIYSLAESGDTIAIESPIYFSILQVAKNRGLNVIEIPTDIEKGIDLDALKRIVKQNKIKLCLLLSNYSIPLGCEIPDEKKKEVVKLLSDNNIPLIEDDLFGDLYFGTKRPTNYKTYDKKCMVLWCGSVSKTLAPGYRVGWVAPGIFKEKIEKTKFYNSLFCNSIVHEAIGSFLENGRYEAHLKKLRIALKRNATQYTNALKKYFPEDTKFTIPKGGNQIWVELNNKINTIELYNIAIANGISISPGRIYTLENKFNNCFKIDFGLNWTPQIDSGLKKLGELSFKLLEK